MLVKVIPLPTQVGIKFDVCLESGYAKTFELDDYAVRQYRGASITEIIEQIVLDFLQELGHTTDSISIIFC